MRRDGTVALVAVLVVASLGVGYLAGSSVRRTETITSASTYTSTSTLTTQQTVTSTTTYTSTETASSCVSQQMSASSDRAVMPILIGIYINGSLANETESYSISIGSYVTLNLTAMYPWQYVNDTSACLVQTFSISSQSPIPVWLHVSPMNSTLTTPYGRTSSADVMISVDATAPVGQSVTLKLLMHYIDPASGVGSTDTVTMQIVTSQ
jgi:hypothetical protein